MSAGRSCVIPATPLLKILPCLGSAAADNSLGLLCSLRLSPVPPPVRGFFFACVMGSAAIAGLLRVSGDCAGLSGSPSRLPWLVAGCGLISGRLIWGDRVQSAEKLANGKVE